MARVPVYNLEWQDPPAPDSIIIDGILVQLQNHPGRWARILTDQSTTSHVAKWKGFGAEARHVRTNQGEAKPRYDIYARWPAAKAPTMSRAVLDEAKRKETPAATPTRTAVAQGTALQPAPGGYLAGRAARGISPEGTMP